MKAFGFVGDSGSGKTTLVERLIAHFAAKGLRVAAVKHAHEGFDMDRPGKDSYRFREAGARQVLVASARRWALLSDEPEEQAVPQSPLSRQLARLADCDLVLVEGYRGSAEIPYIEVKRRTEPKPSKSDQATGARPIAAGVVAIATDEPESIDAGAIAILDLNNTIAIAGFIADRLELEGC